MESSILQSILWEAVIGTLARQLQPYMGHPRRRPIVPHRLKLSQDLQWRQLHAPDAISDRSRRCSRPNNHARRHIAEFSYIPTLLLVTLALTAGPTVYIAIAESQTLNQTGPLVHGIVQLFIPIVAAHRMFGDCVAGKSRKYLASQTFKLHGQLPFHDDKTAAMFHSHLESRVWSQIHRSLH